MTTRSVGEILRAKREKSGLSLTDLATRTKISPDYLTALERNQWDRLPDIAFIKGYINAYAQVIGFDPTFVLALLRRDYPRKLQSQVSWLASFQSQRRIKRVPSWLLVVLASVLFVVLGYIFFQWRAANQPPPLAVYTPENQAQVEKIVVVRGITIPKVKLKINGNDVALNADGSFETKVSFPVSGLGAVVVQASDEKGRTTEVVRQVQVK